MSHSTVLVALDRLREALTGRTIDRAKRPHERRLRAIMRRMFAQQRKAIESQLLPEARLMMFAVREAMPLTLERLLAVILAADEATFSSSMASVLAAAFQSAGEAQALDMGSSFALSTATIQALMAERAADRIAGINATTRDIVRDILVAGAEQRQSYTAVARILRQRFDEFRGPPVQRHIRDRAELVAITEVGQAYVDGQLASVQGIIDAGIPMEKAWLTVGDDRVSDGCQSNQGAGWIEFADAFPSGHPAPLRFPGCRCAVQMRPKP